MDNDNVSEWVTRIDLARDGRHVNVEYFFKGWQQNVSSPNQYGYGVETTVEALLQKFERQGFVVWMTDGQTGRALRGNITRIDFLLIEGQMHIRKYPYGWTARTPHMTDDIRTPEECEAAIKWCSDHGWLVRRWPGGGRAWAGPLLPVRDYSTIKMLRHQISQRRERGEADERNHFNLAFDY